MFDITFFLVAMIVSGLIGGFLGMVVNKLGAGAALGFFLGPIGWIIVFLLPREDTAATNNQTSQTPLKAPVTKSLTEDSYKLYLAEKYSIKKNEVFDQFVCEGEMFQTLEDALEQAHEFERERELERERIAIKEKEAEAARNEMNAKELTSLMGIVFLCVGLALLGIGASTVGRVLVSPLFPEVYFPAPVVWCGWGLVSIFLSVFFFRKKP